MNREEAATVLKQILTLSNCLSPYAALMPPDADSVLSKGYQIHINAERSACNREVVSKIAQINGLMLIEENGTLVIYKPLQL